MQFLQGSSPATSNQLSVWLLLLPATVDAELAYLEEKGLMLQLDSGKWCLTVNGEEYLED
jgi:Mn-dependent DtxR family transcriptional regulator